MGLGTIVELSKYSSVKLQVIMKMKEVQHEWSENNNK